MEGFVEISNRTGLLLTAEEAESYSVIGSDAREATTEEIEEATDYFLKNNKCKFHIFVDTPTGCGYYSRKCLICKKNYALI